VCTKIDIPPRKGIFFKERKKRAKNSIVILYFLPLLFPFTNFLSPDFLLSDPILNKSLLTPCPDCESKASPGACCG